MIEKKVKIEEKNKILTKKVIKNIFVARIFILLRKIENPKNYR
jgi:hypothetical protein